MLNLRSAVTFFVVPFITDTVPELEFVTYIMLVLELTAI
jgi:hypothetical protein